MAVKTFVQILDPAKWYNSFQRLNSKQSTYLGDHKRMVALRFLASKQNYKDMKTLIF